MKEQKAYMIDLNVLKQGVYKYDYQLDDAFFHGIKQDEIMGGNVEAELELTALSTSFVLKMHVVGEVKVVCDRCLEQMVQAVEGDEQLTVKLTNTLADDDIVAVDPEDGVLDVSWLLYELVEISLPIVHSHQKGECNPQMEELLQSHLCTIDEDPEE